MATTSTTYPAGRRRLPAWRPRRPREGNAGMAIGLALTVLILLAGFLAPLPFSPTTPSTTDMLLPPGGAHWFGTDQDGFDIFSRTIAAAQRDLPLALIGTLMSLLVGVPIGLVAAYKGRVPAIIMRAVDIFQAFPLVIIAIAIVTITGDSIGNVVFAVMAVNVPRLVRLVRSEALALTESRFIEAARAIGATRTRILFRHILPNVTGVIVAQASLAAANAIAVIAALSFLGVGVSPPNPSWGSMIRGGAEAMTTGEWWIVVFPGAAVLVTIVALNLIGDGLQARMHRDGRS